MAAAVSPTTRTTRRRRRLPFGVAVSLVITGMRSYTEIDPGDSAPLATAFNAVGLEGAEAVKGLIFPLAMIDERDQRSPRAESPVITAASKSSAARPSRTAFSGSRLSQSAPAIQAALSTAPLPTAPPAAASQWADNAADSRRRTPVGTLKAIHHVRRGARRMLFFAQVSRYETVAHSPAGVAGGDLGLRIWRKV